MAADADCLLFPDVAPFGAVISVFGVVICEDDEAAVCCVCVCVCVCVCMCVCVCVSQIGQH